MKGPCTGASREGALRRAGSSGNTDLQKINEAAVQTGINKINKWERSVPSRTHAGPCEMLSARALVLRVLSNRSQCKGRGRVEHYGALNFVVQIDRSNSIVSCTLQDLQQAHLVVPGHTLQLSVVGIREDGFSLLVDVEEGSCGTPACIAQVNSFAAAAAQLEAARLVAGAPRKRQFFAGM